MRLFSRATLCALVSLSLACSSDDGPDAPGGDAGSAGAATIDLPGSGGRNSGTGGRGSSPGEDGCELPADDKCVEESYEGESVPLDIYIMFDQSGSMCSCVDPGESQLCPDPKCNKTRLQAIQEATAQFLRDPKSSGIGVGIGYFGKQPIGQAVCEAEVYAEAAVPIAPLPDHADAILDSLERVQPTGETPTGAAIRGACDYATAWRKSHPHEVVILLLTDGKPEAPRTCANPDAECCPTLDDAVAAATECRNGKPGIRTYVLGVGPLLGNLEEIAIAGGTEHAYLVEGGDVSTQVLQALNRIRGDAAIPCEFQLPQPPSGQELAYDQVNIKYADSQCDSTYFYYVQNQANCAADGGWYYDDAQNPQKIHLCPTSCDLVTIPGGRLFYNVGCQTMYRPR